ncbi:MAG: hypothetical protein IH949_09595 [Bacteroidetes bacterium]|nr:hypothetical protein [Bacteroidota bacterium]
MRNFNDDFKYNGVKRVLQNLKKIEAPLNFEQKLFERINQGESENELSFIDKLFLPSRIIPSAGLAVTIVLIFFLTNIFVPSIDENPLLANPRVRIDVISKNINTDPAKVENKTKQKTNNDVFESTEKAQLNLKNKSNKKTNSTNDPNLGIRITGMSTQSNTYYNGSIPASVSQNGTINKRGLDYKQIYLQRLQRAQIEQMRKRIEALLRNSNR